MHIDWSKLSDCFSVPAILVFHPAIEEEAVSNQVTPELTELTVQEALARYLLNFQDVVGYATVRNWQDIAFLETILSHGGEIAVLQGSESQELDGPPALAKRTARVLSQCSEIHRVTARSSESGIIASGYIRNILTGLAAMRASTLETSPRVLTVRPMAPSGTPLPQCENMSDLHRCTVIELKGAHSHPTEMPGSLDSAQQEPLDFSTSLTSSSSVVSPAPRVMALLFADVKGFSRLQEAQLLRFANAFLGSISRFIHTRDTQPRTRHTWGDGLFFTFEGIADAGVFALDLADMIEATDWQALGLPTDLSVRIGLHAGPVYECFDPVSEQRTFVGIHVNHAARIEPITPPGNVYASEAFAALASAGDIAEFHCEYVGRTPLAKGFGMFATYHVRR